MFTILGLTAVAVGAVLVIRYGLRALDRYISKLDTWTEFKDFAVDCLKVLAGGGLILIGFRVLVTVAFLYFGTIVSALARVDMFCGWGAGLVCPGMIVMAAPYEGHIHAHVSASGVAAQIAATKPARVVIGGHSAGCSAAVTAAWHLYRKGKTVDLLLCFDGATNFMETKNVPPNVILAVSWRQDGWLGGARLCKAREVGGICRQKVGRTTIIETTVPLDHFTIGGYNARINGEAHKLISAAVR